MYCVVLYYIILYYMKIWNIFFKSRQAWMDTSLGKRWKFIISDMVLVWISLSRGRKPLRKRPTKQHQTWHMDVTFPHSVPQLTRGNFPHQVSCHAMDLKDCCSCLALHFNVCGCTPHCSCDHDGGVLRCRRAKVLLKWLMASPISTCNGLAWFRECFIIAMAEQITVLPSITITKWSLCFYVFLYIYTYIYMYIYIIMILYIHINIKMILYIIYHDIIYILKWYYI